MAIPRAVGGSPPTERPSISMSPVVNSSRPANKRSRVLLPQPDGPTSTRNSPEPMERSIPFKMARSPNDFLTCLNSTFANARYLFGRAEYAHWESERSVENARGFAAMSQKVYDDSVLPVMQAGLVDLVGDDHELLDALLRIRLAPGHTPGSITIDLTTPQRRALFTGDILHHPIQVLLPEWNSAFCGAPEQARQTRRRVLEQCAQSQAVLMPAHFGKPHCGHVHRQGDAFSFAPLQADS